MVTLHSPGKKSVGNLRVIHYWKIYEISKAAGEIILRIEVLDLDTLDDKMRVSQTTNTNDSDK